jgi:hypothetical protein
MGFSRLKGEAVIVAPDSITPSVISVANNSSRSFATEDTEVTESLEQV